MLNRLTLASTSTLEARMTARDVFLNRDTPVTEILRPFADGTADWETTKAALLEVPWADVASPTSGDLLGHGGSTWVIDNEPGNAPDPGTWREVTSARDLGVLTGEQYDELSTAVDEKAGAAPAVP